MMLVGHDIPWQQWRNALEGERMHHAWLLTGKQGLGKAQFAHRAARLLVGADRDAAGHPDIHLIERIAKDDKEETKRAQGKPFERKRNIAISQIRAMQRRLTTRPTLGERRAIIIDAADDLEKGAANALLKSLEEPPQGSFFLLVAHQPARLLPTIRSRGRTIRFLPLGQDDMRKVLAAEAPDLDGAAQNAAIAAASGSPGAALRFVEFDLGAVGQIMEQIVTEGDPDFALRGKLAQKIGARPDRAHLRAILDLARGICANAMGKGGRAAHEGLAKAHDELVRLGGEVTTYNYDPGLFVMQIGTLLAGALHTTERAYG